jgi:citrate synthase
MGHIPTVMECRSILIKRINMQKGADWIDRAAATEMLGVRPQTLYAYVSRGLIKSKPDERDPRRSHFSVHDIQELAARKKGARRRRDIAYSAISWGEPILDTAISTFRDGRLMFRGQDAAFLSRHASLEEVARLLWQSSALSLRPTGQTRLARSATPKARVRLLEPTSGHRPAQLRTQSGSPTGRCLGGLIRLCRRTTWD